MKIILLQDVKTLGKKGEMVEVSDGYARNMIIPKKLGVPATEKNKNDLKLRKAHEEKVAKERLENAEALKGELAGKQIVVSMRAGEGGKAFGSVSAKEIAEAAKAQVPAQSSKCSEDTAPRPSISPASCSQTLR